MAINDIAGQFKVEQIPRSTLCQETPKELPESFVVDTGEIKTKDVFNLSTLVEQIRREHGIHTRITITLFQENWTV